MWDFDRSKPRSAILKTILDYVGQRPERWGWWLRAALLQLEAGDAAAAVESLTSAQRYLETTALVDWLPQAISEIRQHLSDGATNAALEQLGRAVASLDEARRLGNGDFP